MEKLKDKPAASVPFQFVISIDFEKNSILLAHFH